MTPERDGHGHLGDEELVAWEEEDREEAEQLSTVERQIAMQAARVIKLEKQWTDLAERAAAQGERARDLEDKFVKQRGLAVRYERRLAEREAELERMAAERRALAADLVGTQKTLQARTEQLQNILASRWFRVTRSAWKARRRRPPWGAMLLGALAVVVAITAAVAGGDLATTAAGLLAATLLAIASLAYTVLVPALRDRQPPRMAREGSPARPLDPAAAESADAEPAPQAGERSGNGGAPAVRLVPRPEAGADVDLERERWLAGARTPSLSRLRVAGVLDEMSAAAFGPECELDTAFAANDWRERLGARPPHLLLVESAWSGNGGGWQYCVASYEHRRYAGLPFLRELVEWCRENDIPTVFWNKEDPVHFDRFSEAATLFDHVFTTDADRVEAYRGLAGRRFETVEALPFAAQPKLHNPIPVVEERRPEPVFAGTFYRDRHPDRQARLEAILDAARSHGLVIYDRMLGSSGDAYGFPERFREHIEGRLSYEETVEAYKRHLVFLNANSVAESPTMFSRRVFELLACGTAVLSTASTGMQTIFGDLVPVAETRDEAATALRRLLEDDGYREDLTGRAQALVLSEHTYRERLLRIAQTAGFDIPDTTGEETTALSLVDSAEELSSIVRSLAAQGRPADEVVLGADEAAMREWGSVEAHFAPTPVRVVPQPSDRSRAQRLRELAAHAATPWVAPLSPSAGYEEDHLKRLVACTRFAEAEIVGSASRSGGSRSHSGYRESVSPTAAIASRELIAHRGWPADEAEVRRWFAQGVRIYAASRESL